jgi:hypothetical protein
MNFGIKQAATIQMKGTENLSSETMAENFSNLHPRTRDI